MSKKYGYLRCSTNEKTQDVARQLMNMELDEVFVEYASGKNISGRPVFQNLLSLTQNGDEVYCQELSRFGRNVEDVLSSIKTLREKGVSVHFVSENLSVVPHGTNPMQEALSELIITVISACNSLFLAQTSIAVKQGQERARQEGKKIGGANPQWRQSFDSNRSNHVSKRRHSEAQKLWESKRKSIESVIAMMRDGKEKLTYDRIAHKLCVAGVENASGNTVWNAASARRALECLGISR